jgi:hypothetical protein
MPFLHQLSYDKVGALPAITRKEMGIENHVPHSLTFYFPRVPRHVTFSRSGFQASYTGQLTSGTPSQVHIFSLAVVILFFLSVFKSQGAII